MLRPTSLLTNRSFTDDDRAIEGLPIRLVIALVVGVASLSIMMSMLGGIGDFGTTEVTVEYDENVIDDGEQVTLGVITEDGEPVEDATVMISRGSLNIGETYTSEATEGNHNNEIQNVRIGTDATDDITVDFRSNQDVGTLEVEIIPPSDGDFEDSQSNSEITIINT